MRAEHDVICRSLVGRDSELASARRLLGRSRDGAGQVALIVGEAGVGKSRLLRAIVDDARAGGFFVLQGACFEAERSIPYAPLVDLVRLLASTASPALAAHVLGPAAPELVAIFPELRSQLPDTTPAATIDPESDKRRLFHSLAQALTDLARTQPVLLAFEDVHWSDDSTLELVLHLSRRVTTQPIVIALTYRGEEVGPRLAGVINDLDRARAATELTLDRLDREGVDGMIGAIFGRHDDLGQDFVSMLHGLTDGNPFFVEETLKSLLTAGDLIPGPRGAWRARPLERVRIPRTAVEAVRRRLATLTVPARGVASIAAVAGRRFDFELLRALTHLDEPELLALVKELIAAQIVVEESAERFAFRHALTREAIFAELLTRERIALHREIAAALLELHADSLDAVIEALEYHAWEAGEWERAASYAERAARHALALSSPREAITHLDRAFIASNRAGVEISPELYLARARTNETLGDFHRADADFSTALALAGPDSAHADPPVEWEAVHGLGMLWAARDYTRAGDYRRAALAISRRIGERSLVARSLNRVGNWHVNHDEPQDGLPYHREALGILEQLGDRAGVAETVDLISMAHHIEGDERAAATSYERSIELFTATDNKRGLANALSLLALCGPSYHTSSTTPFLTATAREELRSPRCMQLAREIGWRAGEAFSSFVIADALAWRGEYDRAIPLAFSALGQAEEIEHLEWTAGASQIAGFMLLDLLAVDAARTHLERAFGIAERLGSRVWVRWTAAPLALARSRAGDVDGARRILDAVMGDSAIDETRALTLGERALWLASAEVMLAEGRPAAALSVVEARSRAEDAAHRGPSLGVPSLSLLGAEALVALERFDDAHALLERARDGATAQDARPMLWRIEAARGRVFRRERRRLEARRAFDAARAIADELAARISDVELRERFQSGLRSLIPATSAPSEARLAKATFGGLTRRERDVAQLVAQGKANKHVARALGIGERTVEGYVASALAKLGFQSRAQLAAWAVDSGLHHPASAEGAARRR